MTTLLSFLFALALLVFIHELGHYSVARWCGVKVLRFSIGFGKPLVTWRVGPDRTEWSLSPIPLGGYVKMLDEREEGDVDPRDAHRAFNRQSLAKRCAIVVAGPAANFLLAIVLYGLLAMSGLQEPAPVLGTPPTGTAAAAAGIADGDRVLAIDGAPVASFTDLRLRMIDGIVEKRPIQLRVAGAGGERTVAVDPRSLPDGELERDFARTLGMELRAGAVTVGSVVSGSAAAVAGILAGDEVVRIDQQPIHRASELIDMVRGAAERPLQFTVRRGDTELQLPVTPRGETEASASDAGAARVGKIGAALQQRVEMVTVDLGPVDALAHGAKKTWDMSIFSLRMLGKMATGDLSWKNLSGPVAIADFAGQSARIGWYAYVAFLALISVSLGVLNLLPVPVLDGGHLVYYALEAIKGRPLSERFMQVTQKVGLAMVACLMIVALFNDLTRLLS
jgi:regulator of sigma E protease